MVEPPANTLRVFESSPTGPAVIFCSMRSKRAQGVRVTFLLLSMRVWRLTVRVWLRAWAAVCRSVRFWRDRRSLSAWYGTHASTFGGNPVACAAANVVVKRLMEEACSSMSAPWATSRLCAGAMHGAGRLGGQAPW